MRMLFKTLKYVSYTALSIALLLVSLFLYSGFLFYRIYSTCEDMTQGMDVGDAKVLVRKAGFEIRESEVDYRLDLSKPFPDSEKTYEFALRFESDLSDFSCIIQHNGTSIVWANMYDF